MDNKKIYISGGFIILACVLIGGYFFERSRPVTLVAVAPQSASSTLDPLNATYNIDGVPVTLVDGRSEQPAGPGSAETITTQIFGEPALGDVNGDGMNDAAVVLVQSGAGSGTFYYAAVALATSTRSGSSAGGIVGTNAILLGDRIAPDTTQIENGIITVNYADRKPTDSMSTPPSVGVSKYLVVEGIALYDASRDIYPLPSGVIWNAAQSATVLPGEVNVPAPLVGIKILSQLIANITDLAAPSTPFENYYRAKLAAAGWTVDNAMAAGAPGAEIDGYKKGDDYIILEYNSVFKNEGNDSPETCPCDMTFSVFAGTLE